MNKTQQIRELARQAADAAADPANDTKRAMWAALNNLEWTGPTPVMLTLDVAPWRKVLPADCMGAADPVYRLVECELRKKLWYAGLGSDMVIEPWIEMKPTYFEDSVYQWGVQMQCSYIGDSTEFNGEFDKTELIEQMHLPRLHLDGTRTLEDHDRAQELLYPYLTVRIDWRHYHLRPANLGVWPFQFFGQDQFYRWCVEQPDTIHRFMALMAETYVRHNREMERRGRLVDNHCFIQDFFPFHGKTTTHPQLANMWVHGDAECFEGISPTMLDEYLIHHLQRIYGMFQLGSFGCCESLDRRWGVVKKLPNLRRITISQATDPAEALREMGGDYVYVVRPNLVNALVVEETSATVEELRYLKELFRGFQWHISLPGAVLESDNLDRCHLWMAAARKELQG